MKFTLSAIVLFVTAAAPAFANVPPDLLNYQGVLRDATDHPLSGNFDMIFRLIDAPSSNEILVDRHDGPLRVTVTGGLFNVRIGGGVVSDGAGPGVYTTLSQVFRDFSDVLLRVEINTEILSPDVRVLSAGYALNSTYLNGVFESQFLRSDENDTAVGKIFFAGTPSGAGISQGPVFVSPTSANANDTLLGVAVNSSQRFKVDAEGDTTASGNAVIGGSLTVNDTSGISLQVDNDLYVDTGVPFVGVGRSSRLTSAEAFGIRKTTGPGGFGGMYVETTDAAGLPFYGYAANGSAEAYTYLNAGTGSWHLYNGGTRLTVEADGDVGIGTTAPAMGFRLEVAGIAHAVSAESEGVLALLGVGIDGSGTSIGGAFRDTDSSSWAHVAGGTAKIIGSGSMSFVQNHPYDSERVIVYAAPEGDEVATYTRGSARLVDGEARVALGPTFEWVTNPSLGLTAHLTPRGDPIPLAVADLTTKELIVRGPAGSSASFDYIVWGLRIGFEEQSIVQEKTIEAFIPSMKDHRDLYSRIPELRTYNARERFTAMTEAVNGAGSVDLSGADALRAAIQEYDPAMHGPVRGLRGFNRPVEAAGTPSQTDEGAASSAAPLLLESSASAATVPTPPAIVPPEAEPFDDRIDWLPVDSPVEGGEVLVFDPDRQGQLRQGDTLADPAVAGIALGPSRMRAYATGLEAPIAFSGLVFCMVDASYGAIRPGDLLSASPTPGHAMRSFDALAGTVVAKAAEALESGTGLIRVVVMPR